MVFQPIPGQEGRGSASPSTGTRFNPGIRSSGTSGFVQRLPARASSHQRPRDGRGRASSSRTHGTSARSKARSQPGHMAGSISRGSTSTGATGSSWPGTGWGSVASERRTSTCSRGSRSTSQQNSTRNGASTSASPQPYLRSQHGPTCDASGKTPVGELQPSSAIAGGSPPESTEPTSSTRGKSGQRNGQVTCRINRKHPLVQQVLRGGTSQSSLTPKALIRLLEETVPVAALRVLHQAETIDDPEPFADVADAEAVKIAERIRAAYIAQGLTPQEARSRIRLMPPFDQMPGFWQS